MIYSVRLLVAMAALCGMSVQGGPPKNRIIFRLDDVQDWWVADHSRDIINMFIKHDVPLAIGVLGGKFFGDDAAMVKAVKDAVENHNHEVFNHGDDASTLFNQVDKATAKRHIEDGEEDPFKNDYVSFVPHQNRWAESTLEALVELGYRTISASKGGAFPMPVKLEGKLFQMPTHTQTADYAGGAWTNTVDQIMPACKNALTDDGFCVVMMHPQEFDKGTVTLDDLEDVILGAKSKDWKVTTFRDYANEVGGEVTPTPRPTDKEGETKLRNAKFTYYESYAPCCKDNPNYDPNYPTDECDNYSACKYSGDFAALGHKSYEWVKENDIIAFYDDNHPDYEDFLERYGGKKIHLKWQGNGRTVEFDAIIADTCGNNDCGGCCRRNSGAGGYLVDIEINTVKRHFGDDFEIFEKGIMDIQFDVDDTVSDCVKLWGQCGGMNEKGDVYDGETCCAIGDCHFMDKTWSQCRTGECLDGWQCTGPTSKPTSRFPTNRPTLPGGAKPSVIFRLDDVQDHYLSAVDQEIFDVFRQRDVPLSIGVIGAGYYGQDVNLHKAIVDMVGRGSEVFNHGDDASTFFNTLDKATARKHIENGEEEPFKVYKSFVPHQNRWNEATLEALEALGYDAISASKGGSFPMPVRMERGKLKLMPQHTETAEYAGGAWDSRIDTIMPDCTKAISEDGFCVVMMHPQEFEKQTVTYEALGDLLDQIEAETDWHVTTFRRLAKTVERTDTNPTPEPTAAPTNPHPYYVHWGKGTCVNDGNQPDWQQELFDTIRECCTAKMNWKIDACVEAGPSPVPAPTAAPSSLPAPTPRPTRKVTEKTPSPTKKVTEKTPSPTSEVDAYEAYSAFCEELDSQKACKKPCSWSKSDNDCSPKPAKKVKCKKLPKGSPICTIVGCEFVKKKKCTGKARF